jgi:hypothetical protein
MCRKHRRKMGDVMAWDNILISMKKGINGVDSPQQEIYLDVIKRSREIRIEYVPFKGTIDKKRLYIEFTDIENITYPTESSITLELQDDDYITFVFPTPGAKQDFKEAITIVR